MGRTRIKICGVCRVQDAELAVRCGADAIGIVREASAGRFVDTSEARQIAAAAAAFVTPVLLFVDQPPEAMRHAVARLGTPCTVQLHGEEPISTFGALAGIPVIKAVRMDSHARTILAQLRQARPSNLVGVVLETPGQSGGSGVGNDWDRVKALQAEGAFEGLPIIAAGGLTPETVGEVVRLIRPYAVDVSSGVEERKREKSEAKVKAFVAAVRAADQK